MESNDDTSGGSSYQPMGSDNSLWAEEREEDGVWGVFLKKIRYQRPSAIVQLVPTNYSPSLQHGHARGQSRERGRSTGTGSYTSATSSSGATIDEVDSDQGEIAHLMWETVRVKVLRAGTLRKIVEAMSNDDSDVQATHLSVFLATYRAFATPTEVLQEIIYLYTHSSQETLRKVMLDCLNAWLDSYSEDFESGGDGYHCLRKIILPFAQEEGLTSLALKIQYKLRSRRKMKKSTSLHSLRTFSPQNIRTYSLLTIPESHFAQQLTYFDKELFLNLRVWECLGGLWKRRCGCGSVVATVEQFNALSGRVVATILLDSTSSLQHRAKIVEKWIRISQELRQLKNFSSLKAIIAGLESNPIFRLSKLWHHISKDRLTIYSQLSQIFSEENNRMAQRSLLEAEGTAKFPTPTKSPKDRRFLSRVLRSSQGSRATTTAEFDSPNGTIPYLGTFLTDLTFIDSAYPDYVHDGLINFDKRKKEFEILAQLKLLQGSAKGYRLEEDPYFTSWYNSLKVLDDKTAYELSIAIQPERLPLKGHRKSDSFASNSSSENTETTGGIPLNRKNLRKRSEDNVNGFLQGSVQSSNESSMGYGEAPPVVQGLTSSTPESSVVVKVSSPAKTDVMYKSMIVSNSDHTPQVIAQALEKLGLEGEEPKRFSLVQVLTNKELKFPANANVFYALDNSGIPGSVRLELRPVAGIPSNSLRPSPHPLSLSTTSLNNNNNLKSKN